LRSATDTSITDDTNGEPSGKTSETDRQTSTKVNEPLGKGHFCLH
jgi:hypothetical protein